jgi:hypothetical protein
MKYSERDDLVAGLRELADYLETSDGVKLPQMNFYGSTWIYKYGTDEDGNTDYSKTDDFLTRQEMRKLAKALAPCEKDYSNHSFNLKRKFGKYVSVTLNTSRENVCERKVVGTKEIEAQIIPARTEEIVEWECRDSILR